MKRQWKFGKQFLIMVTVMVMMLSVLAGCGNTEPTTPAEEQLPTEKLLPTIQIVDAPEKMGVGDQVVLHAAVENADGAAVQWKSSDAAIAQVDADGTVHAAQEGVVTITAQVEDQTDTVEISVLPHIQEITLEESAVALLLGTPSATHAIAYQTTPADVIDSGVQWTSSAPEIVTVDADGNLVAVASGSCTVTGKAVDTTNEVAEVTLEVSVAIGVSEITLSETELTGYVGKSAKITATVEPQDAANKKVEWTSSDEAVATVDASGNVKFLQAGDVTITCSAADGGGTNAQCVITSVQGTKKVQMDTKNVQLILGAKESAAKTTLTYTLTPENTSFQDVTWTSSDETIATVDANGNVTALAAGKVTITAVSTDPATKGSVKDTATIVVGDAVKSIALNDIGTKLIRGKTYSLKATLTPEKPLNGKLEWTSSNENVLKVDGNGRVTVVCLGKATITAKATDGSEVSTSVSFTGIQPVKKITYSSNRIVITEGDTFTVKLTVDPADATDKSVTWTSSDTSVATIDKNGVLTGKRYGKCTITATANDGSKASVKINVVVEPEVTVDATTFTRSGYFGYYTEFAVTFKNLTATKTIKRIDFTVTYSSGGSTKTLSCYTGSNIMRDLGPGAARKIGWWQASGLTFASNFKVYLNSVTYKDGTRDYYGSELIGWFY